MGIEICKKKRQSNLKGFTIFKNDEIKNFQSKEEFNLLFNKTKSYKLYNELSSIKDTNDKIKQFNEILSLNNYDENIIYDYLSLLKEIENNEIDLNDNENKEINTSYENNKNNEKKTYNIELEKYLICLSKDKYFKLEKKQKKGAIDYLKEFFLKLSEFDGSYLKRSEFYNYLNSTQISVFELAINFTDKDNKELYLYYLFFNIFQIFKTEMNNYADAILNSKKSFEEKRREYLSIGTQNLILKMDEFMKSDITLILYSLFFDSMKLLSIFIRKNITIINNILNNDIIDFYILEGILLLVKSQIIYLDEEIGSINEKLLEAYFNEAFEELNIKQLNEKYKNIKIIINGDNLEIFPKCEDTDFDFIKIENYQIYNNLKESLIYLDECFYSSNNIYIKYYLTDHVKLKYFQNNNYVKYSLPFINYFNDKIAKSKTIISIINQIYPEYEKYNLLDNKFILSLFEDSINNAKFYPFKTKIYCTTFYHSLNINYQLGNKMKHIEIIENFIINFFKYIILNLGFFVICEYHEVLGHYLREYLKLLTKINYESPRDENSNKESGTYIQSLLLDNKREFNLLELLFILDFTNYNVDYKIFKKYLSNIDVNKYQPSNEFKNDLKTFFGLEYNDIKNLIIQDVKKNNKYNLFSNFKTKNSLETYNFEMHTPCSVNLRDAYIENKKREKENDIRSKLLKKQMDLYLSQKSHK